MEKRFSVGLFFFFPSAGGAAFAVIFLVKGKNKRLAPRVSNNAQGVNLSRNFAFARTPHFNQPKLARAI